MVGKTVGVSLDVPTFSALQDVSDSKYRGDERGRAQADEDCDGNTVLVLTRHEAI
jgi:hypothetical protein